MHVQYVQGDHMMILLQESLDRKIDESNADFILCIAGLWLPFPYLYP